jgi:hypothetical protein
MRAPRNGRCHRRAIQGPHRLQLYPNNQLGTDTDMLSQVRAGAIDFFTLSPLILGTLVPAAQISGIGFAFKDYSQVWPAMDGELGAHVRSRSKPSRRCSPSRRSGTTAIARSPTAPAHQGGRRPQGHEAARAAQPAVDLDVQSLRCGTDLDQLRRSLFGPADQDRRRPENPWPSSPPPSSTKCRSTAPSPTTWDGWFLGNKKSFERLPKDLQDLMARIINEAAMNQRADVRKLNDSLVDEMKGKGLAFNNADADSFRAKLRSAGFYAEWKKKFGDEPWTLLEKYTGKLA